MIQLLRRFRARPELLQPCYDEKISVSEISTLLVAQILVWIEECGERDICITGLGRDALQQRGDRGDATEHHIGPAANGCGCYLVSQGVILPQERMPRCQRGRERH